MPVLVNTAVPNPTPGDRIPPLWIIVCPPTIRLPVPANTPALVTTTLFWNKCVPLPCIWKIAVLAPLPITKFVPLL